MGMHIRAMAAGWTWLIALLVPAVATAATLHVRRVTPGGTDVPMGQEVVIQFDRKMVPLGKMARASGHLPVTITPAPGCQWRWLDVSELACRLRGKRTFRPATHYHIRIGTRFKALDGATLAHAVMREFTTLRPKVTWPHFVKWRSPVKPVYLVRFNLPVTAAAVEKSIYIKTADHGAVAVHATPYRKQRLGPVLVPVPDAPGAIMAIDTPSPKKPLDADKKTGQPRRQWTLTPLRDLPADADFVLASHGGLTTPLGPLPGTGKTIPGAQTGHTFGAFRLRGIRCKDADGATIELATHASSAARCRPGSVALRFSAPVTRATLAASRWTPALAGTAATARQWKNYAAFYLAPPRDITASQNGSDYPLPFTLKAMHGYRVTLPAGVKDQFGRALATPQTLDFRTGHRTPFFSGPPGQVVLEAGEPTIAPLRFTNLSRLDFDYQTLHAETLPTASGSSIAWRHSVDLLALPHAHNRQDRIVRSDMDLRHLLGNRSGVAWGTLQRSPNGPWRPDRFFGEVTPYQITAKVGHFNTLVWVDSFKTGAPVAGAAVHLYRGHAGALDRLTRRASAVTDADGLAVLPGSSTFAPDWFRRWSPDARHRYIGVTHGKSMGLLPLDGSFARSVWDASDDAVFADTASAYGHMRTWAVTGQGIYRPGGTVKFDVFARNPDNQTLQPAPKLAYAVTIVDAIGNIVYTKNDVHLSAFGDFAGSLHVANTAPTGWYGIHLIWKSPTGKVDRQAGRFLVTEFVPASFKVDAMLEGKHFGAGARIKAQFQAQLHAGGPYSDAQARLSTHIQAEPFAPQTAPASGFRFDGNPQNAPATTLVSQDKGTLGHDGRGQTVIKLPKKTRIQYGQVQFEAAVKSSRGTWVAGRTHARYATRNRFIGLRTDDWILQARHKARVHYLVVDSSGKPRPGGAVTLALQRRRIKQVRVKNAAGDFDTEQHTDWVSEDTCKRISTKAPQSCELTPQHPGSYRILGTVTDTHGNMQTTTLRAWATGAGDVLWSQDKAVTLVPDKSVYHGGDTAHVLVQNPFPGAKALVTVERYGVLWKKVLTLQGSAPVIDVPIGKEFFPGAYLSVTLFSPRTSAPASPDLGKPEVGLGYIPLKIAARRSALKVTVKPDAATHKPRQTVSVQVSVQKRHGGAAGKTRLVAIAVDQAVVDLLQDHARYYNPVPVFQAPPGGPDMQNFSLAEQLLSLLKPKAGKGENPGGGGGSASSGPHVRSDIRYSAYWNATLTTDAEGKAHFAFQLPDNLTRWRIFVIAMRPGAAMGFGDAGVRVNLPIQVEAALPNQVHVGDHFGAGFAITNRTQTARTVATTITATGDAVAPHPPQHGTLHLGSYDHAIAWTHLVAQHPGALTLTGSAQAGALGDALRKTLPVRRAGAEETAAQYGSFVSGKAQVPIRLPGNALPDSAQLQVTLSPTLVGNLAGAFTTLRDDPLRTWETRLSRSVLASDYLHLTQYLGDSAKWPGARGVIAGSLRSAADFQAPDGGMTFWIPRKRFVSPYLSVYTALAFNWLSAAGHPVPAAVRSKLQDYLLHAILAGKNGTDDAVAPVLRAGALAALAPTGTLDKGAVAAMLPELHQLRLFGQGLLLQAALDTHDRASSTAIVQAILAHGESSAGSLSLNERQTGTYLDILATPLRANCEVLDALVEAKRQGDTAAHLDGTAQKLMRWVIGQRRNAGGWPNSQENVFCTTAITHYAEVYEPSIRHLSAHVSTPQVHDKQLDFATLRTPAQSVASTLAVARRKQPFDVELAHAGSGRLYYNVRLDYALPPDSVAAAGAGMTITRHYAVQRGKAWLPVTGDTQLGRGDVVRVTLGVDTPTERHHVVLSDPLPGTFEAVNRQLATAMTTTPHKQDGRAVLMFDAGPWPNMSVTVGGFYHRETALDAVRFYAEDLPAGHYTLIYAAQVISPGQFIAPAPHIKAIYQPDIFGRGKVQHIKVALPDQ